MSSKTVENLIEESMSSVEDLNPKFEIGMLPSCPLRSVKILM